LRSKVSIVKGGNAQKMVQEAVDLIGGVEPFLATNAKVFVKPNLGTIRTSRTGATTDPNVTRAVIDVLHKRTTDITIIESDSATVDTETIWSHCGYDVLAKEKNVRMLSLSKEPTFTRSGYRLPAILFSDHVLVNVPKIKTNDLTIVTCSLKNLFGLIPTRYRAKYHKAIDNVIVDLNRFFRQNLIVVDGLIAMEGDGPLRGSPVNMNVVIAGDNPVAVDVVVCNIIGLNPSLIPHIKMASEAGLGPLTLDSVKLAGESIDDVKRIFKLPSTLSFTNRLRYKALEHSEKPILRQAISVLRWLHRK
jgi:uncharacterized protein (DUF362 family)